MFVLIFSFLACSGSNDSGTSGMPYCEETSQSIARDDDSAIGIPASNLLDALPFAEDLALSWAEGVEDSLTWSFEADESTLVWVQSEAVFPTTSGPVPSIDPECGDYLSISGVLSLDSGDGRLQEAVDMDLEIFGGGMTHEGPLAIVSEEMEITDLDGPIDTNDYFDPSDYDAVSLYLAGEIYFSEDMSTFVGRLQGRGETTDGQFAMLESIDIASWGPAEE